MPDSLFRQEAIEHAGGQFLGETRLIPAPSFRRVTLFIVSGLLLLITGLAAAPYARTEPVSGAVDTPAVRQIVASGFGELAELQVSSGSRVVKGQLLGVILQKTGSESAVTTQLAIETRNYQALKREIAARHDAELQALQTRKEDLLTALELADGEVTLQRQRLEHVNQQTARVRQLHDNGYLSESDWLTQQSRLNTESQTLNRLMQARLSQASRLRSLNDDIDQRPRQHQQELSELAIRMAALERQRSLYESQSRQALTAPADGVVTRLSVNEGSWVQPGMPLMTIAGSDHPVTRTVSATVFAPSRVAGYLEPGQVLQIRFDDGSDESAELTGEVTLVPPHPLAEGAYRGTFPVRLQLPQPDTLDNSDLKLLPGMQFTTRVVTERKRLFEWVTDPLLERLGS